MNKRPLAAAGNIRDKNPTNGSGRQQVTELTN